LRILDSTGTQVRVLQEGMIFTVVSDFSLSTSLFEPDGTAQVRIWDETVFEAFWNGSNENGKLVASGQYFVQTICTDSLNQRTVVTKPLTVMRPKVQIVSGVRLSPNPAHDHVNVWVVSRIAGADVRVKVYTLSGELVSKLEFNNSDFVVWNLTNTRGEALASGVYLVVIMASDPQSGLTERQILKLAVTR
jgi:flagellar hook assembly protein FlgD